jgi:cytochrome c oxidase subunit 3
MIFISFTSAYVVRQGLPTLDPRTNLLLHDWFPVPLPRLLLINTGVLLISLGFLTGQWMVWRALSANGFYVSSSPSSSFVYLLTGMHGVHLFGGVVALLTAGVASALRRPADSQFVAVDVTAWYWHFMALLWIYILCLLEFVR